jgi:5'-nucleotidase
MGGNMATLQKLTLLHSNDLHGDFLAEDIGGQTVGGVSMLSGYVEKTRREQPNTLYCIAGDMLQGSLIDTEFRGVSTVDIMNLLNPDVAALGNHEADYGLAHLLFLERCARFPIVNANLYIKHPQTRIFKPYKTFNVGGIKVMFIGIITEDVLAGIKSDNLYSSLVDTADAAREVGRICNAHRKVDIDLTVLLTHIGFEEDCKLAALLDPDWGVDIIIGGHSHTVLEKPAEINDILIVQAGVGTDQIGHFDLVLDTDTNTVSSYQWRLVSIEASTCPRDTAIDAIVEQYRTQTDSKYGRVLCKFPRSLTHPSRYTQTELGTLVSSAFADAFGVDVAVVGSGTVRKEQAGPVLTQGDLMELCPFDDKYHQVKVTGAQFKAICRHIFRPEAYHGDHTEYFQFSQSVQLVYTLATGNFESVEVDGVPLKDDQLITLAVQGFHYNNAQSALGLLLEELVANDAPRLLATNQQEVLIEYLLEHMHQPLPDPTRVKIIK